MKGGSRYGAGRPGWHAQTSDFLTLDVRRLARERLLRPGLTYRWQWHSDPPSTVDVQTEIGAIRLIYKHRRTGEVWQDENRRILLTDTPCFYGGLRQWFLCPRCGRRVAILYLRGGLGCRHCLRLAYPSQSEDYMDRLWRRQAKIERRLGGEGWLKPKGMHWTTFERLHGELRAIEETRDNALAAFIDRWGWTL